MRKKLFTLLSLLALIGVWAWAEEAGTGSTSTTNVAKIGDTEYASIQAAIDACPKGTETTITLMDNVEEGASFGFPDEMKGSGRNIVLDLNGKIYKFKTPAMGSTGYETQAMHLINGNKLTVKNGTLAINPSTTKIKRLIQNYCDLTLEDVTVDTESVPDIFSNYNNSFCRGTVTLKGKTVFKASSNAIIFDIDGTYCSKPNGGDVELVIDNSFEGSISGKIEYVESTNASYTSKLTDKANYLKANIGNNYFATVEEAVSYAENGATIELLNDVNTDKQIEIPVGKEVVLDLKGHKIEYTGSVDLTSGVLLVHNGAGLTVKGEKSKSEIKAGAKAYAALALTKQGDDASNPAKLTIESGKITGYYYGIVGNGGRHNTDITIKGGTITGTCENDNLGIYHPQNGILTITGGQIEGYSSAIELRAGTLNISGGSFKSTATTTKVSANGSGNTTVGAAIAIAQHTTKKAINVNISEGNFSGCTGLTVFDPQNNNDAENVKVTISGGTIIAEKNGINAKYGTVNISGGTIEGKTNYGVAVDKCTVNISDTANITSKEFTVGTGYGTGAIVNISGGTLTARDNAVIGGNGNKTDNNNAVRVNPNKFNISGGTFNGGITSSGYVACGIYAPWKDEFNVTGGTFNITNGAGIVARAGVVNVSGNVVINCTGRVTGKVGDSRVVVTCSPIVFDSEASYPAMTADSKISVTGGKFSSEGDVPTVCAVLKSDDNNKRIVLRGGTFSSDPNKFCAEGYYATKSGSPANYAVEKIKSVEITEPSLSESNVKIDTAGNTEGVEAPTQAQANSAVNAVVTNNSSVSNFDTTPASESLLMTDAASTETSETVKIGSATVEVKGMTIIELVQMAAEAQNVSDESKNNIVASDINQIVKIDFNNASVKKEGDSVVVDRISFNIKPTAVVMVEDKKVELPVPNALIANPITFRLPVDKNTKKQFVQLYHKADGSETEENLGLFEILTDGTGNKYVEVSATNFSEYGYSLSEVDIDVYLGTATKEIKAVSEWTSILETTPNAIAIVNSELASWAEKNRNVIVKYTAGSQEVYECKNFVLTDLEDFYTPVEFKALRGSYNRQPNAATNDSIEYNSVCLPFAFDASDLSETAKILTFAYYDNANTAYFNHINSISAGIPCIIQETETSWKEIDLTGKTIVASPNKDGNMRGTFVTTNEYGKNGTAKTDYYSVGEDNKFSPLNTTLSPFRSCLWLHNDSSIGQGSASAKAIRIIEDGEATGIESVDSSDIESQEIYTINGMKVSGNAKSLPRGMYIMNGKKFIIR